MQCWWYLLNCDTDEEKVDDNDNDDDDEEEDNDERNESRKGKQRCQHAPLLPAGSLQGENEPGHITIIHTWKGVKSHFKHESLILPPQN